MIYNRINITPAVLPVISILTQVKNVNANGLDLSPDYQRGYIWDQEYKEKLILSLVLNYPIGNIVINHLSKPNYKNAIQELVDGKQRLTTLNDFFSNELAIKGNNAQEIIVTIEKIVGETEGDVISKLKRKKKFYFKDLPKSIQANMETYNLPVYTMQAADSVQIREYFKVLQNQDKLRAGEIINAIEENKLSGYFEQVGYDFLETINYTSLKRAEFEKIYYSVCATVMNKIPLNVGDKSIINFVENLILISNEDSKIINSLNENLNYIKNTSKDSYTLKMSKRNLKMIIGISGYIPNFFKDNTINKVIFLITFSNKLSAFNSSESDDNSFGKYYGDEYSSNKNYFVKTVAPTYRRIYNVFTKSTSPAIFKTQMKSLAEICENDLSLN